MKRFVNKNTWVWAALGTLVIWTIISILSGGFSLKTLFLNVTLATFAFFLGLSEVFVITCGEGAIDLSVAYTFTLTAYISAKLFRPGTTLKGILIIFVVCILIGLVNSFVNVVLKVHAMIGTMAVGYILFTVVLLYAQTSTMAPDNRWAKFIQSQVGGFSILTVFCIIMILLMVILLYHTKFGKQLHAVGQGHLIAKYAGINVNKILTVGFIASSLIAGLGGVLCCAYVNGSYQTLGDTYQMSAISSAMIGGTLVSGGKSSVVGTYLGAVMLTLLGTLLNLTGLARGWQYVIEGAIIIALLLSGTNKK